MSDDLKEQLRFGVCQDQYDDIEIYETEKLMKQAAARIETLEILVAMLNDAAKIPCPKIAKLEAFARRVFDYSNDAHLVRAAEALLNETRSKA